MSRIAIENGTWFDDKTATSFSEKTWWNGNNHISVPTGSQWEHQRMYLTAKGSWVLNEWSQWQGSQETYTQIDESDAFQWLITNGHADREDLPEAVRARMNQVIEASEV